MPTKIVVRRAFAISRQMRHFLRLMALFAPSVPKSAYIVKNLNIAIK